MEKCKYERREKEKKGGKYQNKERNHVNKLIKKNGDKKDIHDKEDWKKTQNKSYKKSKIR